MEHHEYYQSNNCHSLEIFYQHFYANKEDCVMGDYGEWSSCTKECGGGTQIRTREIIQQAENNGTACGQQPLSENRACNVHDCAGTNSISN